MKEYLANLLQCLLIIGSVLLILQEDFLVEKVPFIAFYTCKLIAKTLGARSRFKKEGYLKDFMFLWLVCFGRKALFDLIYYHINWLRYARYMIMLAGIDLLVTLVEKKGYSPGKLLKNRPVKTFLMLANGICDAISLENVLWRNNLEGLHLDAVVFISVTIDPLFYTVLVWLIKGQKKEKNFYACQYTINFGVLLIGAHALFSINAYYTILELRRRLVPFNSSNVMTPVVGMRILNCCSYTLFAIFNLVNDTRKTRIEQNKKRSEETDGRQMDSIKQKIEKIEKDEQVDQVGSEDELTFIKMVKPMAEEEGVSQRSQ